MNKNVLFCISLFCFVVHIADALPLPQRMAKRVCGTMRNYGRAGLDGALRHKYALVVILAGGIIIYESETVQKLIKELLGLTPKKTRIKRKRSGERILLELGKSPIRDTEFDEQEKCSCACEEEGDAYKFRCPCECEDEGGLRGCSCECEEADYMRGCSCECEESDSYKFTCPCECEETDFLRGCSCECEDEEMMRGCPCECAIEEEIGTE